MLYIHLVMCDFLLSIFISLVFVSQFNLVWFLCIFELKILEFLAKFDIVVCEEICFILSALSARLSNYLVFYNNSFILLLMSFASMSFALSSMSRESEWHLFVVFSFPIKCFRKLYIVYWKVYLAMLSSKRHESIRACLTWYANYGLFTFKLC